MAYELDFNKAIIKNNNDKHTLILNRNLFTDYPTPGMCVHTICALTGLSAGESIFIRKTSWGGSTDF